MKKVFQTKLYRTKVLLPIILVVVFAGTATYFFSLKPSAKNNPLKLASVNSKQTKTVIRLPSVSPTSKKVLGASSNVPSPTPGIVLQNQSSDAPQTQDNSSSFDSSSNPTAAPSTFITATPQSTPTQTPIQSGQTPPTQTQSPTQQPTATPTIVAQTVMLEIQSPEGTSNFSVTLKDGANVCDVLQTAKDEREIKSLTLDDTYLSAFNSKYVLEINGYKDNWTFKVNGASPLGCSLSNPKPNDTIVWKFG